MANYKLYILKVYEDDFIDEMEYPTLEYATEIIQKLKDSSFAPTKIELLGYKDGIETLLETY